LFETWSQQASYNVAWTLLPPLAIGAFDQFVSALVLDKYPEMYRSGQTDTFYNHKVFLCWVTNAFFHASLLFFSWYFIMGEGAILSDGRVTDNWIFGTMVYFSTMITVIIKHTFIVSNFVFWITFSFLGSLLMFSVLFPIVNTS
jgi:phospholipid-transporting ATPase